MRQDSFLNLSQLPYFTKDMFRKMYPDIGNKAVDQKILRAIASHKIVLLKNGVYTTYSYYNMYKTDVRYFEYIASSLKYPCYISLEYVLNQYNILTDGTVGYSCVTLKGSAEFSNIFGNFSYKKIKQELFTGYIIEYFNGHAYYKATKAKALFDFLYYKSGSLSPFLKRRNLVEDLRLNMEEFTTADYEELRLYVHIAQIHKLDSIIENIITHAPTYSKITN